MVDMVDDGDVLPTSIVQTVCHRPKEENGLGLLDLGRRILVRTAYDCTNMAGMDVIIRIQGNRAWDRDEQ